MKIAISPPRTSNQNAIIHFYPSVLYNYTAVMQNNTAKKRKTCNIILILSAHFSDSEVDLAINWQ